MTSSSIGVNLWWSRLFRSFEQLFDERPGSDLIAEIGRPAPRRDPPAPCGCAQHGTDRQ
jgi:hypothetical protein